MTTREKILKLFRQNRYVRTPSVVKAIGISRQAAAHYLKGLVEVGLIQKQGSTRNAVYFISGNKIAPISRIKLVKTLNHLEEDKVFEEIERRAQLKKRLSKSAGAVVFYAFTEMLNNAIDHSNAKTAQINLWIEKGSLHFTIRDKGIGIFKNVMNGFRLKDEVEAADLLLKGKHTTFPARHSGQGIFFTSKIADRFTLRSHKITLTLDNEEHDVVLGETRPTKGTEVSFSIRLQTRKKLQVLFDKYSEYGIEFDKNILRLKHLSTSSLVSRSQARRITMGLEPFESIVFDFEGVKEIGQAFADEIFRVFADRHPGKRLSYANAAPIVEKMIARAVAEKKTPRS